MTQPIGRLLARASLLLALSLTGCGDSDAPATASPGADTPRNGGVLKVAFDGDPNCLDPHQAGNSTALNVGRQLTDSLTDQDPQTSAIVPWLAQRWEISSDSRRFTFHLREGVTFSDGTPLDGAAVKANFEAIVRLGALAQLAGTYLAGLQSIEVPDPLTVTIEFRQPNAQFLQATSTMSLGLFAKATLAESSEARCQGKLIGSGPFVLKSFVHNQSARLEHRADYAWPSSLAGHRGRAWLDAIEFLVVPESGVRLGSLLSGQIDVNTGVAVQDEAVLEAQKTPFIARPNPGIVFNLTPNESRELLAEPAVRQALNKAIDRNQLQGIISRYQKPATSVLASSTPFYRDRSDLLAFDPQGAAALLDGAGWRLVAIGDPSPAQLDPATVKTGAVHHALGRAALTLSGANGIRNRRAPAASKIALAITAPIGTIAGSPPPWGVSPSFRTRRVSISGSHENRGTSHASELRFSPSPSLKRTSSVSA